MHYFSFLFEIKNPFQCCKGVGLLNSGFCLEYLPQIVSCWIQWVQPWGGGRCRACDDPASLGLNSTWRRTKPVNLKHVLIEVLVNGPVVGLLCHLKGFALNSQHVHGQEKLSLKSHLHLKMGLSII